MKRVVYVCVMSGMLAGFLDELKGATPTYSVVDLGLMTDLSGRSDAQPNGLSPNGQIAASNVSNGAYQAQLFNGQWTGLGTLGGPESLGADVNDLGRVVGHSKISTGSTRAFLWTPGGTDGVAGNPQMRDLGTLGGTNSEAYAINASGQISGYAQTAFEDHAFLVTGTTLKDIGTLLGNGLVHSYGLGLNKSGHVVGEAYSSSFAAPHAFYYDGTTATDIGNLGGVSAAALAINDNEQIAGYSANVAGFEHAFRYISRTMTDLGTLGGGYSYAVALNNSNIVVGGSYVDAGNTIYHAFVSSGNSLTDLNGQLDSSGTGWTLVEARAINDAGQIVGVGRFGGVKHGFLLRPASTVTPSSITKLDFNGHDVVVSFTTQNNADYAVEQRNDFESATWSEALTGINGTGALVTQTIVGAAGAPRRFFRVTAYPR
jgi:probable HAF family extracellular repeat protein